MRQYDSNFDLLFIFIYCVIFILFVSFEMLPTQTAIAQDNPVGEFLDAVTDVSESAEKSELDQTSSQRDGRRDSNERGDRQENHRETFKADRRVPLSMPIKPTDVSDTLYYSGYAEDFYPIRQLYYQNRGDSVYWAYKKADRILRDESDNEQAFARGIGKLGLMERGTIYLLSNDQDRAIDRLSWAEKVISGDEKKEKSSVTSWIGDAVSSTVGGLVGQGEMGEYEPGGFEKVLMLNYESIAYLLNGDRGAYNIARRSINWQDQEHKKFRKEIEESKENLKKQKQKTDDNVDTDTMNAFGGIGNTLDALYGTHENIATDVPNAFVNPFGHYVQGMINEYDAYKDNFRDRSLLDNAQISYEKGLELNPDAQVMKDAVKELDQDELPPENTRLVHVVGGIGFAPVKKTLKYGFQFGGVNVPVRLPKYEPFSTPVDRITVETTEGDRLSSLSVISNLEALVLRHQQDRAPKRTYKTFTAVTSNYFQRKGLSGQGLIGALAKGILDEVKTPDTRSWSSLPKYMIAGRMHLDKEINRIKLVSRDEDGQVIDSIEIDINDQYSDFVYTRAIKDQIIAMNSEKLWMNYY